MGSLRVAGDSLRSMVRLALLLAGLATYFLTPDDLVWQFVKSTPHARPLQHFAFGLAAILLGVALILKVQASTSRVSSPTHTAIANLLQATGIGFLLPLAGFLLFVVGDTCVSLVLKERQPAMQKNALLLQAPSWRDALFEHIGLGCAFVSMVVFSIVLVDRVADALFASSATISLIASSRRALSARLSSR